MKPNLISKKPVSEMSDKERKDCKLVANYLAQQWCDKYKLADILNLNERTVRDRISTVAKYYPVISTSDSAGYKRAKDVTDLPLAKQTAAELQSRINELEARKQPLEQFIRYYEFKELYNQSEVNNDR